MIAITPANNKKSFWVYRLPYVEDLENFITLDKAERYKEHLIEADNKRRLRK